MTDKKPVKDLLLAALDVFGDKGFEGASTRAIAGRANAHQQQITYHFGSKDQLWRDAVAFVFARFQVQVADRIDGSASSHESRLRRTVEDYLRFCRDNPQFSAITMWERSGSRGEWLQDQIIRPMMTTLYRGIFDRDLPPARSNADIGTLSCILLLCQSSSVFTVRDHLSRGFSVDVLSDAFFSAYVDSVIAAVYPLSLAVRLAGEGGRG